jgi:hypothetical protein
MWADDLDDIERNITSSNVEFLEGRDSDSKKKSNATLRKVKDKPESASASFDNTRHSPDVPGLIHDHDDDMNDIMSVHDQMTPSRIG